MSEEKTTSDGTYLGVFVLLAIMTAVQLGVSFSGLGHLRLPINMAVAAVQVVILSFVFMHLKGSDSLTKITAAAALFFLGLLFMFVVTDYLTRQWGAY